MRNLTLTAVRGLRVGHADDPVAATGCTVVLGPFVGAVEVYGFATGSRELDALSPLHLVPRCDALLLTGGSAFGLGAADGVMRWLEERDRGFVTRAAKVPIVPAAVIYDLGVGSADVRPDAAMGYEAADAASDAPVREGRHGVGAGASVGKLQGPEGAQSAGIGSWADLGEPTVAAMVVVNAFGDVLDQRGKILAGARAEDGSFVDTARSLRRAEGRPGFQAPDAVENTTLGVVATDAELTRGELKIIARHAAAALAKRISPAGTLFDGDIIFALSTAKGARPDGELGLTSLALRAENALEAAIARAVGSEGGA